MKKPPPSTHRPQPPPPLWDEIERAFAKYQPDTKATYTRAIRRFFDALEITTTEQARAVNAQTAMRAVEEMTRQGHKPATVATSIAAARRLYRWWLAYGKVQAVPTEALDLPAGDSRTMEENVLLPGEDERLLEAARGVPRDYAIILTLLRQGWRISELCRRTWRDVITHEGKSVMRFWGKGNKLALQAIRPEVIAAVRQVAGRRTRPEDPFISDADGNQLTSRVVYNTLKRYTKRLKLSHRLTPHGLRATYISKIIAKKGIEAARQLARHKSIGTTQRYSRFQILDEDEVLGEG